MCGYRYLSYLWTDSSGIDQNEGERVYFNVGTENRVWEVLL